jgi:hypothetical protein
MKISQKWVTMRKLILVLTIAMFAESSFAWRCCQQGGGDAPGTFLTKNKCKEKGYVVKDGLNASCGTVSSGFLGVGNGVVACARKQVHPIIDIVRAYASSKNEKSDKFKHCGTSCILKKRCGALASWAGGHNKEIKDLFDKVDGNSYGSGDNDANRKGRQIAEQVSSENGCLEKCAGAY